MGTVSEITKHPKYKGFKYSPQVQDTTRSTAMLHLCGSVAFNVKASPTGKVELWCAKCNEKLELQMKMIGEVNVETPESPEAA